MNEEQTSPEQTKRLRDTLWKARRFASQVTIHAFNGLDPSKASEIQDEGNALIDAIDEALYGDER